MHITNIGINHWHDPDFFINRPQGSGDYLILLIKSKAIFTFSEGDTEASAGNVVLYKKGTPQFYRADGERFGNDWFHFLPDNEEDLQFLQELDIAYDRLHFSQNLSEPAKIMEMLCHEYFFDHPNKTESINLLLRLFFIKLSEALHSTSQGRTGTNYEKISALRIAIYNDPARDWSISAISNALAMSPSSFQHTYKRNRTCKWTNNRRNKSHRTFRQLQRRPHRRLSTSKLSFRLSFKHSKRNVRKMYT